MKLGMGIQLIGVEALLKKLGKKTVTTPLGEGIKKITLWLQRLVQMSTPVGTPESTGTKGYVGGRLRASITSEVHPLYGKVGTIVEYAPFVEHGTRYMEARHVTEGSSTRILGKGMFTYALEQLKEKLPEHLKEIGNKISAQWKF